MLAAAAWAALAASGLLLGGVVASAVNVPRRMVALFLGFGAGALISALAFDLSAEAVRRGGTSLFAIGIGAGAVTYYAGNLLVRRLDRRLSQRRDAADEGSVKETGGPGIVLGVLLDGIPESVVLGARLVGGASVPLSFLVAVFLSNVPEAIAGTRDLRTEGHSRGALMALWLGLVVASAATAALGNVVLSGMSDAPVGLVQAFAAGAILVMLADTAIPEAFDNGGDLVGLATTFGFGTAFLLSRVT